jgi:hypothetical protein
MRCASEDVDYPQGLGHERPDVVCLSGVHLGSAFLNARCRSSGLQKS